MKAMVLFSGGIDSTTCLALAVEEYGNENVIALSLRYGQKHVREMEASKKLAKIYGVEYIDMDLSNLFSYSDCSLLSDSDEDIPKESYAKQLEKSGGKPVSTYVPFRNGIFLSVAAGVSLSKGCEVLYYGAHSDDAAGNAYPDCSEEFNKSMSDAIYLGSGNSLKVKAPFINKNKAQVVKKGLELKVPYQYTWSCYEGSESPCGKCGTCIDRAKAFAANGVEDPYEQK